MNTPLDRIIDQSNSPMISEILKLLSNPDDCFYALKNENLLGVTSTSSEEELQKFGMLVWCVQETMYLFADALNSISRESLIMVLSFEAGRRYEKEQTSISELERMMK